MHNSNRKYNTEILVLYSSLWKTPVHFKKVTIKHKSSLIDIRMSYGQTLSSVSHKSVVGHIGFTALSWGDWAAQHHAHYVYRDGVRLWERDLEILDGVSSFGAMTTGQIRELYFHGLKSRTSAQTVLKRLVDNGALSRIHVNIPDNPKGGSPTGCYQIGKASWKSMYQDAPFRETRDQYKLLHTLFAVDAYIAVKRLERTGVLKIEDDAVESDAWDTSTGYEVHPDIYLHLDLKQRREYQTQWLEVDRSNEYRKQITEKVQRYVNAYKSGTYAGDVFPRIVFIARTEERVRTLKRYMRQVPEAKGLVVVYRLDEWLDTLV